jgi:hypothetical protein
VLVLDYLCTGKVSEWSRGDRMDGILAGCIEVCYRASQGSNEG